MEIETPIVVERFGGVPESLTAKVIEIIIVMIKKEIGQPGIDIATVSTNCQDHADPIIGKSAVGNLGVDVFVGQTGVIIGHTTVAYLTIR